MSLPYVRDSYCPCRVQNNEAHEWLAQSRQWIRVDGLSLLDRINLKMSHTFFKILVIAAIQWHPSHAFSSATGSCAAGDAAIDGGPHLKAQRIITGSLATGGFSVKLGATTLTLASPSTFTVNVGTTLTITGQKAFTGFFMRLGEVGGVQTDTALSGTGDVKVPRVCTAAGVGGVCQTSGSLKTSVTASLILTTAAASMPLDVIIVVVGDNSVSEYYYSQFLLSAIPANTSPTMNPVGTPSTFKPVVTPTMNPLVTPTMKPVVTPTMTPVKIPGTKPVKIPGTRPVKIPGTKPT